MKAKDVSAALRAVATPERATANAWFFKTGPGQYGEGDQFLGVTVPQQRKVAKQFKDLPLKEVELLIMSPWHEERLTGLFVLVGQFKKADETNKKLIYEFYMSHTECVNNWDLVDSSAEYIVGPWLDNRPEKMIVLGTLASSNLLWDRRIAIIATFEYIRQGRADEALIIAKELLHDPHDLIQKAVGWMLREVGKRVDSSLLVAFLEKHAKTMPRTTLRYAIEHFSPQKRAYFLGKH
ncbi:MAG TPA: DNA alkylation repair protein [Candidatus Saccharimonadales bacterium]|nr:DNA alkylation repair protein [Candidatus Saccharimonadales bacterium]